MERQHSTLLRYVGTTVLLTLLLGIGFGAALTYQYDHLLFLSTSDYAAHALGSPAGAASYVATLWAELCSTPWAGAIASALLLTAAGVGTGYVAQGATDRWSLGYLTIWIFAGSVFSHPFLFDASAWLFAVGWCLLWAKAAKAQPKMAWIVVVLAYLSGGVWAMALSGAMVLARMVTDRQSILWISSVVLAAGLIPLASAYLYGISIEAAYEAGASLSWWILLFSVGAVVVGERPSKRPATKAWWSWVSFGVVTVVGVGYLWGQSNPRLLAIMQVEQAADRGQWAQVLENTKDWEATHKPSRMITFLRNTALHRQGRLLSQMFDVPQVYGPTGLFFEWSESQKSGSALGAKLSAMGYQSAGLLLQAYRLTYEDMVGQGVTHYTLRHLAAYNRALGRHKAAERFEHLLGHSLRDASPMALPRPAIGCDTLSTRSNNLIADLEAIVATDTTHHEALEYLTALYLLAGHTQGIAALAHRWTAMTHIPEMVQQALLASGHDFTPSGHVAQKFERFVGQMNRGQGNPGAISADLHNTYWFYMLCLAQQQRHR